MKKSLFAFFVALVASSCGTVDNAFDCSAICNRYQSCFDSNYDVNACASRCRASSADDSDLQRQADVCDACIDERSCTSATFNCAASCGSIVP